MFTHVTLPDLLTTSNYAAVILPQLHLSPVAPAPAQTASIHTSHGKQAPPEPALQDHSDVPAPAATRNPLPPPKLDFNDYSAVFKTRSTTQLLRAYAVLKACSYPGLVKHADTLLATSRRVLGDGITFGIVRQTFFKHFCAGMCQPPSHKHARLRSQHMSPKQTASPVPDLCAAVALPSHAGDKALAQQAACLMPCIIIHQASAASTECSIPPRKHRHDADVPVSTPISDRLPHCCRRE